MSVREKVRAYHGGMSSRYHRYCSWEHCYGHFRKTAPKVIAADRDHAALHLAFYLASWGMYRGSSFLLQHDYRVHLSVIDVLAAPKFELLWKNEFGAGSKDALLIPVILDVVMAIRSAYEPFASANGSGQASDTLLTKVILGTFGCLPACDRYFIDGFKHEGYKYSYLNKAFIERTLHFCRDNSADLMTEQARIEKANGVHYPLMKLVDMYFWQIGSELDVKPTRNRGTRPARA